MSGIRSEYESLRNNDQNTLSELEQANDTVNTTKETTSQITQNATELTNINIKNINIKMLPAKIEPVCCLLLFILSSLAVRFE